jgi:hypothetical protein
MLKDFIGALEGAGLAIGAEELLDLFWLASRGKDLTLHQSAGGAWKPMQPSSPPAWQPSSELAPQTSLDLFSGTAPTNRPAPSPDDKPAGDWRGIYPPTVVTDADRTVQASLVSVPAGRNLDNALGLIRALRPLRQGGHAHSTGEIDEERTVELTAEMRTVRPQPVFRTVSERWLAVDIVCEDDAAIELWYDLLHDLTKLFRDSGLFLSVRSWRLRLTASSVEPAAQPTLGHDDPAAFLEAPTGARVSIRGRGVGSCHLVIFAHHGCSPHWTDGVYARLLKTFSDQSAVLLLGLRPRRRWRHTQIGEPHGLCRTDTPGPLAAMLHIDPFWWRVTADHRIAALVPVPAAALDAGDLADWSRMFMAMGRDCSVYLLDPARRQGHALASLDFNNPREVERAVTNLRDTSEEAFQLAVYLSTSPFTIPIARLIQKAMYGPGNDLDQLAEVFLSGILVIRSPARACSWAGDTCYDVSKEPRAVLLRSLRDADAKRIAYEVMGKVSAYIPALRGQPNLVKALIKEPGGNLQLPEWAQPFASVAGALIGFPQSAVSITGSAGNRYPYGIGTSDNPAPQVSDTGIQPTYTSASQGRPKWWQWWQSRLSMQDKKWASAEAKSKIRSADEKTDVSITDIGRSLLDLTDLARSISGLWRSMKTIAASENKIESADEKTDASITDIGRSLLDLTDLARSIFGLQQSKKPSAASDDIPVSYKEKSEPSITNPGRSLLQLLKSRRLYLASKAEHSSAAETTQSSYENTMPTPMPLEGNDLPTLRDITKLKRSRVATESIPVKNAYLTQDIIASILHDEGFIYKDYLSGQSHM